MTEKKGGKKAKKARIEWKPEMSVGFGDIDNQHREMIFRLNEVEVGLRNHAARKKLDELIVYFCSYSEEHFMTEEMYMLNYFYPGTARHRKNHEKFMDMIGSFRKDLDLPDADFETAEKMGLDIYEWFVSHMAGDDKKLADFLRTKAR